MSKPAKSELEIKAEFVQNVLMGRSNFWSKLIDPRRDIDNECGYPDIATIDASAYKRWHDTFSLAARVNELMPKESWQGSPTIYEDEDSKKVTPFEQAWDAIGKDLLNGSLYHEEQGNPIWEYLQRADILSGIGYFGVILLGIDDGLPLNEPAGGINPDTGDMTGEMRQGVRVGNRKQKITVNREDVAKRGGRRLLYLRPFDQSLVTIKALVDDSSSPRFGQPTAYYINFTNPGPVLTGTTISNARQEVHWTRIIHLADNLSTSEIIGVPRTRAVFKNLWDCAKLYGGSAEMYWRGAFPGLSIETNPNINPADFKDSGLIEGIRGQAYDYMQGLDRTLGLLGMTAKSLAPQVVDPTPQIDKQIEAMCIYLGCPIRVFKGSERGELASTQDDSSWNDRLAERQSKYITPRILIPFVDRLIKLGILPTPEQYCVKWGDLDSLTDAQKAEIAGKRTEAMSKYIGGGVNALMFEQDYLTRELGYDEEAAASIIENARQAAEDKLNKELDQAAMRQEQGLAQNPLAEGTTVTPAPDQFEPEIGAA